MATAGVIIASAVGEEEGTSPGVETAVDVLMQPIVDLGERQQALAATAVAPVQQQLVAALLAAHPMLQQPVAVPLTARPMPQQRGVAPLTAADRMEPANDVKR